MPASLDLNLLPVVRQNGQDQPEWPGLYAATPPRGAARGRDADLIALYLTLSGTAPLPPEQLSQLLPRLSQVYYRIPGTVTAALKAVVDELNQYLLERNLRASNTGRQSIGMLTQLVLRGEMLYLAHSGPAQTYLAAPEGTTLMADEVGSGRGLGISRMPAVRYFHATLQPGVYLLLCHQPGGSWNTETVRIMPNQGIEGLRRRLLMQAGPDFHAVLVQTLGGTGKLRLLRLKAPFRDMAHPTAGAPEAGIIEQLQPEAGVASQEVPEESTVPEGPPAQETLPGAEQADLPDGWSVLPPTSAPAAAPVGATAETPLESPPVAESIAEGGPAARATGEMGQAERPVSPVRPAGGRLRQPAAKPPPAAHPRRPPRPRQDWRQTLQPLLRGLGAISSATGRVLGQFLRALGGLGKRLLPDETLLNVTPATMIFLAVLVPVAIGVIGALVYVQRGQSMVHQEYVNNAQVAVERAQASQSPDEQRSNWRLALKMLNEAENYQVSTQSQTLRKQALSSLDALDGVERLDFQPALLSGLGETVQITRMAAQPGELYLLDGPSGIILRGLWVGGAFELDRSFTCGPVPGPVAVGPLIDLAVLSHGNAMDASLIAMDANGSLMFCGSGQQPRVVQLAPPPMNFSMPKTMALSANDLFVLDPGSNAVWIYRNMDYTQPPRLFFGDQVPYMQDVVDMVVNNDDMYLLHSDGRQTLCVYSSIAESPTRCEDPLFYADSRPGRENGPIIPDSLFDQIVFAPPPDPSLYLLDPANQAVFHFSLRLNFQRQYRSQTALPEGQVTAFAISQDRLVFMAIQDRVYFAPLP